MRAHQLFLVYPCLILALTACQAQVISGSDPACDNGIQDGDETGVDCGGSCAPCGDDNDDDNDIGGGAIGSGCTQHTQCASGYCDSSGICQEMPASCVDVCGGACPPCANGADCTDHNQCQSDYCSNDNNQCQDLPASCLGVCGGDCPPCANGADCTEHSQCQSAYCDGVQCAEPPASCSPTCANGEPCASGTDCTSGHCDASNACAEPPVDCTVTCGGACPKCENGKTCASHGECESNYCTPGGTCDVLPQACETTCGGECPTCENGGACSTADQCSSGYCDGVTCANDPCAGVCGGACPTCENGGTCTTADQCSSGYCDGAACANDPCAGICGAGCTLCGNGQGCGTHADCTSGYCDSGSGLCAIDPCAGGCGAGCTLCGNGQGCDAHADCSSGFCATNNECQAPPADCPSSCDAGTVCVGGACVCPFGTKHCAGSGCVATGTDPDHCGSCTNACTGTDACSAGVCVGEGQCMPPLLSGGGRCIDPRTDHEFCGASNNGSGIAVGGTECAIDEVCNSGTCEPPLVALNPLDKCAGGGSPISIGTGGSLDCAGNLAAVTFRWAICACGDLSMPQGIYTDGYDSAAGPYTPGGLGSGVGTNGIYTTGSHPSNIYGTLWGHEINTSANLQIRGLTYSATNFRSNPSSHLYRDVFVSGNVSSSGGTNGTISGDVYQSPNQTFSGFTVAGTIYNDEEVHVGPACDCSAEQEIDVDAIVAAHACTGTGSNPCVGDNNDNDAAGLHPNILSSNAGRIDLHCGHYYFSNINTGDTTIYVHGHVAIYVGGDVQHGSPLTFAVAPTGQLDLFIAGSLCTAQAFTLGSPNYPANARIYVGKPQVGNCTGNSARSIYFSQSPTLAGNVYAPYGITVYNQPLLMYGALFIQEADGNQLVTIHYDRGVINIGETCQQQPPGDPGEPGEPCEGEECDEPGPQCVDCRDCNNQACVGGECGACSNHGDCCAPLLCFGGSCLLIEG